MRKRKRWIWVFLFCATMAVSSHAQTFRSLASFNNEGANPEYISLIQTNSGNFYGTTGYGGNLGFGAVFEVTSEGVLTDLTFFSNTNAAYPYAGVIQGTDGNFYGTTWEGGIRHAGTVFDVTPSGTPTVLYSFCSQNDCADGEEPFAPLVQGTNENFYGTTVNGGTEGYGTVFEITSAGTLTTMHSFHYTDGASPVAGLIQAKNRKFYGTTVYGGTHGGGTVFRMTSAGESKTLYSFCAMKKCMDGANPYSGLVQAIDGNFYGTTSAGGAEGRGTIFEITSSGKLTTLYSFCSQKKCADGANPYAGLIQATDRDFYGTTLAGGSANWGTIYEITASGQFSVLHSFCAKKHCTDGAEPTGGLTQASDGTFYGTTTDGGNYENGTVFSLSMGLGPK